MKKQILIIAAALLLSLGAFAQEILPVNGKIVALDLQQNDQLLVITGEAADHLMDSMDAKYKYDMMGQLFGRGRNYQCHRNTESVTECKINLVSVKDGAIYHDHSVDLGDDTPTN